MMDFLKSFPFITREQYMWEWTVPQIKLASVDSTRVLYLSEEQSRELKAKVFDGGNLGELNDLGVPIFGKLNNKINM